MGLFCALSCLTLSPAIGTGEGLILEHSGASTHIALGPQVAAAHAHSEWDSEIGAELHITRLRDSDRLSVYGAGLGVASVSRGDTLQLSLDLYAGSKALGDVPIGLSVGPLLKAFDNGQPQLGARTTLWLYHGIMPYISLSWLSGPNKPARPGLEVGVKIPFSIWDW